MKQLLLLLFIGAATALLGQSSPKFNLDFEQHSNTQGLPDGWFKWGGYTLSVDTNAHSGEKAGKVSSDGKTNGFGSIAYRIPADYNGKTIRLEGYMKLQNVENGFAGLLLRVDGGGTSLAFDNMEGQNINGTRDWKAYSITLDYPEGAEQIFVAGIMVGSGEAWFDAFTLSIDGQNVQTLATSPQKTYPADADHAFDKGSNISFPALNTDRIDDLELLGRVWGFLKYHHPKIAEGQVNWDYALFRFLPGYLNVKNTTERDQRLLEWINSLGDVPPCTTCQPAPEDAWKQPDQDWIKHPRIGKTLQEKLTFLHTNRHQGKQQYYIRMAANIGNPEFKNEKAYAEMTYPDAGFRLLALYKYWNMIHYFFPYKHLSDKNWNQVLADYIPLFLNASDELAYEKAAIRLIADVQDTHANLWGGGDKLAESIGELFPPIVVRFVENQLVVTDFYNAGHRNSLGLNIGDVITAIDGRPVGEIVGERAAIYPASNEPTRLRDIAEDILRSNKPEITLQFQRQAGVPQTLQLPLFRRDSLAYYRWYRARPGKCYELLEQHNIGYVTLQSIKDEDIPAMMELLKDTRGLVIDIRNYPSTFVVFSLGGYFVTQPTPFVRFSQGNTNLPGVFTLSEALEINPITPHYKGKVVVLVNELTQSQAEYTTMAFRAGVHTTVIGSTTAAADGNVSSILLPGGLRTMISGIGVYTPDGKETQRIGIQPDIIVKPSIEGIRQGRDELLEKAIEVIKG